jgi:hypothetical protein
MTSRKAQKKICRKCGGIGHFQVYEAARVTRRYCDCVTGKKQEEYIASITPTRVEPIWELFSL